jgi:hypothetical protein
MQSKLLLGMRLACVFVKEPVATAADIACYHSPAYT